MHFDFTTPKGLRSLEEKKIERSKKWKIKSLREKRLTF